MQTRSDAYTTEVDYKEITADSLHETPMSTIRESEYVIRYLYSRSSESQSSGTTGQDALRFRYGDKKIAFVVCDGVGQSFNGQLASQFIVDRLLEWTWMQPQEKVLDDRAFPITIREYLNNLKEEGTRIVETYSIPQNTSRVVINVLEEMRLHGSETTFVCGCIYLPNDKFPIGGLSIAWIGDTGFRVWDKDGQLINLPVKFSAGQHWSTRTGLAGKKPNTWSTSLSNIARVAVFSDGLLPIADIIEDGVETEIISDSAQAISKSGASDDISYWEIVMEHQDISQIRKPEKPSLGYFEFQSDGIFIEWTKAMGASNYKISYKVDELKKEERVIYETEFKIPAKKWKVIKFAVRSRAGDLISEAVKVRFSSRDNDRLKLLVASLIIIATGLITYLIIQGK